MQCKGNELIFSLINLSATSSVKVYKFDRSYGRNKFRKKLTARRIAERDLLKEIAEAHFRIKGKVHLQSAIHKLQKIFCGNIDMETKLQKQVLRKDYHGKAIAKGSEFVEICKSVKVDSKRDQM